MSPVCLTGLSVLCPISWLPPMMASRSNGSHMKNAGPAANIHTLRPNLHRWRESHPIVQYYADLVFRSSGNESRWETSCTELNTVSTVPSRRRTSTAFPALENDTMTRRRSGEIEIPRWYLSTDFADVQASCRSGRLWFPCHPLCQPSVAATGHTCPLTPHCRT